MNTFSISKSTPVYLYGAAAIGTIMLRDLKDAGYQVIGFIDRRANEIHSLQELDVFSIDDKNLSKKAVIIVAVKNVWEHNRIANDLINHGFHNILYRPYDVLKGERNSSAELISQAYDFVENKIFTELEGLSIPQTLQKKTLTLKKDGILEERGDEVVSYVPISMLFANKMDGTPQLPVLGLLPHIEFIKYILGKSSLGYKKYLEYCITAARRIGDFKHTDAWKENVLKNRIEVFQQMNHSYQLDKDFFVRNAPKAVWNSDLGCFHLYTGKHRATFLAGKEECYIPICMSRNDYQLWKCSDYIGKLQSIIDETGRLSLSFPLEHPCTYDAFCENEHFMFKLLYVVMEVISQREYVRDTESMFVDKNIYISLQDSGFMKRFFKRCGAKTIEETTATPMEELLDEMWVKRRVPSCTESTCNGKYQYGIIDCTDEKIRRKECEVEFLIEKRSMRTDEEQLLFESVYKENSVVVCMR